jgi:hypothetical protein
MKDFEIKNNWGHFTYFYKGEQIEDIRLIKIEGVVYNVSCGAISSNISDHGHRYTAESYTFMIEVPIFNGKIILEYDIRDLDKHDLLVEFKSKFMDFAR